MDWALAIEKNREALKRVLAMLVAMVSATDGGSAGGQSSAGGQFTFFPQVDAPSQNPALAEKSKLSPAPGTPSRAISTASCCRLLRPAEAAARRLIIIAARGLVVELAPPRLRAAKPKPAPQPKQRFRHRCGDPARSAAGMGPCAGAEAVFQPVASAVRPAQTVRRAAGM